MKLRSLAPVLAAALLEFATPAFAADSTVNVTTPMAAPEWAKLQRQLLAESVPAAREYFQRYFDDRGYLQVFVRWGANDGPDDAFENLNGWPELHALGAGDEIRQLYLRGHEGMIRQYTEAKTVETPAGRQGMYYKEYSAQSDWMHHGEGLQLFNRMALGGMDAKYLERVRRFAGLYMGEDPEAPNYDPAKKIIRSMMNGSRGPLLRKATAIDWVGDPFDVSKFDALHGESTFAQFLAHYEEYTDVVGDHFLNLVATTLPTNAYMATGEAKYKQWMVDYMGAWVDRMKQNGGIIPSHVALDGSIGGPEKKWWNSAYGWGFSPMNPVTGRRENRNRIPRATVGFANALIVTGDQKYANAWRDMINAVNSHARTTEAGQKQYPSMHGPDGWYGWQGQPWNTGALELWYWSMRADDLARTANNPWVTYLQGKNPTYPETVLSRDIAAVAQKLRATRADKTPPERLLADNPMDNNPVSIASMVQLMLGAIVPSREGGLLQARVRYFDPERRRAGVPEDVGALVSELQDNRTVVTLVNLNPSTARTVVVQGGGYGEHRFESVEIDGKKTSLGARDFQVKLSPGAGAKLTLATKRFAYAPTVKMPWDRR